MQLILIKYCTSTICLYKLKVKLRGKKKKGYPSRPMGFFRFTRFLVNDAGDGKLGVEI